MMGVGDGRFVRRAWNGLAAVVVGLTTVATAMAVVMTVRQGDGHVARVAQRFFTGDDGAIRADVLEHGTAFLFQESLSM